MSTTQVIEHKTDSIVCYCHHQTRDHLLECHRRCGSLKAVQEETGAGTACGGCRIILQSLFGEAPQEISDIDSPGIPGATVCLKPGARVMKGFIVANEHLESTIYSSNAVPPQFADCDSTIEIEYAVLNHQGIPILARKERIKTNETFVFDTRRENLPRPFYGQFIYAIGRSNYGASRFNVYWSNGRSTTSTHEISNSGRPDVVLPIVVTQDFLTGPNTVYLALLNPHGVAAPYLFRVFDVDDQTETTWTCTIPAGGTGWFNVNEQFYAPILKKKPSRKIAIRICSPNADDRISPTMYFFVHNKTANLWSTNHL
jgi:hypothetical protein